MPKRSSSPRDLILGLLFFGALFALGYITMQLRSWPGSGASMYLQVLFEEVYGVRQEDSALVHGTIHGRVSRVQPIAHETWQAAGVDLEAAGSVPAGSDFRPHVLVTIELFHPITLHADYEIRAEDLNLFGGKMISILPGDPAAPLADAGVTDASHLDADTAEDLRRVVLVGRPQPHPLTALGRLVEQNQDAVSQIVDNVLGASKGLDDENASGALGYLLSNREARDRLENIVASLDELATRSREPGSIMNDLFYAGPVRSDTLEILARTREFVARAGERDTLLGSLTIADSQLRLDVDEISAGIKDLVDRANDDGSLLARLVDDSEDSLGAKADSLVTTFKKFVDDGMNNEKSLLYAVSYGDLGVSVRDTLERLEREADRFAEKILDPIANSTGMLGYIINEPDSRRKLERLVNATLGIVEDAREAAPVSSLGSFIFGGF